MQIIAVLNEKGGAAKTTTTINLAGQAHKAGRKVAVIDADPQQSAITWGAAGDGFAFPVSPVLLETSARKFKEGILSAANDCELAIVDCPPALTDAARVAALIADLVLVPVSPSPLDLWPAQNAIDLVKDARELAGGSKPQALLVPSRVQRGTVLGRDVTEALLEMGEPVAGVIGQSVALAECVMTGQTVDQYAPGSGADKDFEALWRIVNGVLTNG